MKTVLITGASGFIGSFLVEEALGRQMTVYAGLRHTSKRDWLTSAKINPLIMDLSDISTLKTQFEKLKEKGIRFDYVIHAVGLTKTCRTSNFDRVNYQYTRNLVEALIESQSIPEKFVFISSLAAYGPGDDQSFKPIQNDDTPSPVSRYGKSKLKTENYLQTISNFPYLIFRPTGVYGPRERDYYQVYKSIKMGLEFYVGSKEQKLSFVHVIDLSRLIIDSLQSKVINKAYFVSDLEEYTAEEFNYLLKEELHRKTIKLVFPKAIIKFLAFINEKAACMLGKVPTLNREKYYEISSKNWWVDSMELVDDFDYTPQYDLREGLKQTLDWYRKEKWL